MLRAILPHVENSVCQWGEVIGWGHTCMEKVRVNGVGLGVKYTAHAVVLTKILSQPLRQNVLFSP